ncbi:MAG: SDR family NAD(P)-dependent oxidoreductase [Thermomicrobiales bacterium]
MNQTFPTQSDFAGTVAVVTGGSRGQGAAICRLLAARGAAVVVSGRDEAGIADVVAEIRATGGRAIGVVTDCTDFAAIEGLRLRGEEAFGPADLLVALAGGFRRMRRPGGNDDQLPVAAHLIATFLTVKSFLPGMVERRRGVIVTLPTVAVFARHLARSVAHHGVRVEQVAEMRVPAWGAFITSGDVLLPA